MKNYCFFLVLPPLVLSDANKFGADPKSDVVENPVPLPVVVVSPLLKIL
jgi:hypothetical protein